MKTLATGRFAVGKKEHCSAIAVWRLRSDAEQHARPLALT
jgi:hypothetical protein